MAGAFTWKLGPFGANPAGVAPTPEEMATDESSSVSSSSSDVDVLAMAISQVSFLRFHHRLDSEDLSISETPAA